MTDTPDDFDVSRFPDVVNAVLDLVPTGPAWRARFVRAPGLSVLPADAQGWIAVLSHGDVVMSIHVSTFEAASQVGRARVMVDGGWREIEMRPMPDVDVPDTVPDDWA
jgi:hypothetical protein